MTRPALSVGQSVRVTSISRASPALVKQGMLEVRVGDCGEVATEPDSNGLFQLALSRWTVYWHEEDVEHMTYAPMSDEDLLALQERWAKYGRHTSDVDPTQPVNTIDAEVERMRLASEVRMADIWGRCLVSALVGSLLGYCLGAWAHVHWLGR